MSDFSVTMRDWKRMCDYYAEKFDVDSSCDKCQLDSRVCLAIFESDGLTEKDWEDAERIIYLWAESHPEPIYYSWADYLYSDFLKWCQIKHPGRAKDEVAWYDFLNETHIPKDIAQKLSLEPICVK